MESLDLKIGQLKEIINCVVLNRQEEISNDQLLDILHQINQIFIQLRECRFCDSLISDTLEFINTINNVAQLSLSVKSEVISNSVISILELITRRDVSFSFKVEVLKLTNVLLENCPNITKENLLSQAVFENLIIKFGRQLDTVGDYEYQVGLIECLFRIIPRKFRPKFGTQFFNSAVILKQFLDIRDQDFETDCRTFLNDYNSDASGKEKVKSVPCNSAFLGDRELRKPNDTGYDEFWVDFNFGSNRLTIFCEDCSIDCQDFSEDGSWETLSVWKSDVQRYKITIEEDTCFLDVELLNPIPMLYPSQTGVSGKIVTFTFDSTLKIEEAALQTFGDDKRFTQKLKGKVSLPTNSLCVRARDSPDFEKDNNYDELDEEIRTIPNTSTVQTCPSKSMLPNYSTRVKVSVPFAPVVLLDSSQNSVIDPVQAIAMKYMKSLQPQEMEETAEPEVEICADDKQEGISLCDEQACPLMSKVSETVSCVSLGFSNSLKTTHSKSTGIPTPETPTMRGPGKVKVKTPVAVLTPNDRKMRRRTVKKKLTTVKPLVKSSKHQEKLGKKAIAQKKKKSVVIPDSCQGKDNNMSCHAGYRTRAIVFQKKNTFDNKTQEKAKNTSSVCSVSKNDRDVDFTTKNFLHEVASRKRKVKTFKNKNQGNAHGNQQSNGIPEKSAEFKATKEDCVINSQDSLVNEDTCKEIYLMELDRISFSKKCTKNECSPKDSDSKTSEEPQGKENYHQSSTSDIHNTKTKKMENSEATKEIQQICMKKNLKSKRGKDFEKRKIFPDQEIINKNEVDVIQSSCDFEKFENEQKSSPIASVTGSVSKELSCTMNKITTGCKKDMKKRSKNEIRNNATNEMTSNESNLDNVNGDEVIENMNASVIFGKKSRKCKSGNLKKTPDINKNIEQTMPISTSSDIPDPNENLMAFTADGIVSNSEGDKDAEQNERSKRKNQMELQTKKNYSKNADLDVYDFNEVDQMRSSFAPKTQSSNCKTDKFVKCRIDVQSEIENGITLPCISDGVSVLQKKPLELESEKEKNRKSSASKSEESKSKFDSDDEVVINKTMLQSRNKRLQKQSKEEADITSSVQSSRQTRSKRQQRKTVSKSCTKKPNTDPNVVEEIDVIQSSFGSEKDGVVDRIKSRNEDKLPSMKPLTRGKQNEKKQILVSTPLDNVEEDVENFDEENEILSSIGCSDRDGDKGCMEHLEKNHLTEDLNPFSEKNMYTVNHAEKKDNSDNDRQIKPLTEQTGKHFPNNRKSKSGRPKQKVTQKKESCKLSKLEHRILKNTVNDKKRKFNEYDSDVHSESEDKMQSENGLVLKKGFKSREMKKIKSMKSKMMDFDTKDKNGNANMQKWKTRQNKGRSISEEIKVGSFEKHTGKRKSNRQRKNVEKCDLRESDPESEDVSDSGVIHSSLYPEGDEVLKSQKLTRNENKDDLKEPLLVQLVKRKRNYMQKLTSNPVEDISSGEEGFVRGKNKENLSPLRCNMEHNSTKDKELFTQKNQDQGFDAAEGHGSLKNRQNQLMEWDGKEDCSQSDENSLPLFNTNLSQENAIKSLSQKKFFKDRLRPSTYQKHDLQSTCMSAAGVQTKKSCEVEYGKGKNLVYLAMSYSSTERREDVYGDPYDFDEECARSSTKSEKFCRHEGNSNAKQGKIQTPQNFDVSLKKRNSACKEFIVQSSKENLDSVSELVDDNNFALSPKESLVQNTKETLPKYSRKIVNVVNNDDVSVYSKSSSSGCLLKNRSTSKTHKQQKEHQKKEMPTKNVNRIMGRFLGRKRNKSTCQDLNENEEYDHHDGLCLSKGDSSSPVKIPHCEITLDEVIGISRLNGNTDKLPCFKHHAHRGNQPKPAKLERHEVKDCVLQCESEKENTDSNYKCRSATSKSMTKPKFKVTKRYSDQVPRKMRKASFSEEIEILDSEISDDQLCSSGDDNLNEELPPVNNIITRFNQFCKNIVGGPEDVVQLEKSRKVTSRAFDHASRRKQNKACRKSDPGLRRSNNLWMPKFDPEDQVEICNIKMPMTLPCSDAESSQEETIHSEDLQVQPQQEAKTECNKSRSNKLLQQTRDTDLSGLVSGYSTELRPSRSSMKRKYDSILQCGDESDLCRNHLNASYAVEMSHLRPRRLFSSDFKAVVEITGSSDNEDEEDLCTTSEHNTNSDEMLGNSVNHLEGVGIDAGVSTIVKAFGMDFQKQIQTKQHCVDVLTKTTLKSSQRHLRNMLTDRTERRNNIIEKFGKKLLAELIALQNDIKTLEDNEAKTLDFFQQQLKTISTCRISQEKRLENLKKMQADFVASMCYMDQYELNQQETFKNAMKKDLTSMQRKLLLDAQKHELTAVRRSLHTMIR